MSDSRKRKILSVIKKIIRYFLRVDIFWFTIERILYPFCIWAQRERELIKPKPKYLSPQISCCIDRMFPDLTVRHGPFRGMRFPKGLTHGGALLPELLGSYERELHVLLEKLANTEYSDIIDIGCAEGFYAVGLAICFSSATVFARDTNKEALKACEEMACLNNVADRVITGGFFNSTDLSTFSFRSKGLVLCDCEGYEKSLFTENSVLNLCNCDVLVEIHDFVDISISTYLKALFDPTHTIQIIESIDDIKKVFTYKYDELKGLDLATKRLILREGRPCIMQWYWMRPKPETTN